MFRQRLISGIILVIMIALTLYIGGDFTLIVTGAISLIGMYELYKIYHIEKSSLGYLAYIMAILYYMTLGISLVNGFLVQATILFLAMTTMYVLRYPKYDANQVMAAFFGVFYVAIMMSFIYRLRVLEGGGYLVVLIFISAWGCDTLAYCTGMLIGKHKMAPLLSPKKTIEGAIGGIGGAMLLGFFYAMFAKEHLYFSYNVDFVFPIVCGGGAVLSMIGDLVASAIKRNHDVKDYGKLIPGHGGILDRFDSLLFTAPTIFYLMVFLSNTK